MKNTTKRDIEKVAESWYKRAQKLAAAYKNPHSDPERKAKAYRLMTEMSVRLTKIGLLLQRKPKSNIITRPNSTPVKLIKL